MIVIKARDNTRVKAWLRLAGEPKERRKLGRALVEGVHLVDTCLQRSVVVETLIVSETTSKRSEVANLIGRSSAEVVILSDEVFGRISGTETPTGLAAEIRIPEPRENLSSTSGCIFLDAIQDAGNVGAILRSAAAFGNPSVVLGPGCADPWSPKVLRAAMGGHFHLDVRTLSDLPSAIAEFSGAVFWTTVSGGSAPATLDLRGRTGWVFGSEGAGVSATVARAATHAVTVPMPGGTESLNVAACAAICLYERSRQISTVAARS